MTHDIVAAEVSLENIHDAEVLPTLLNPLRRKLGHVYADGAYDTKACHRLIASKGGERLYPAPQGRGVMEKRTPKK